MAPLNLRVIADNDECRLITGVIQIAPPLLEAGRWSAPLEIVGSGIRFQNVTIPQGATIDSAVLILTASATRVPDVNSRIGAEQEDNPGDFSGDDFASAWARLNGNHGVQIDWDSLLWTQDVEYTSPDISTVIQEIISRAGWVSGQAIVLSWDDFDHRTPFGTFDTQRGYSHIASNVKAAKLNIIYTPAVVLPTVTTNPATSVESASATLNGILDDDGGEACACGFEWGETIAYGNTTPTQSRTTGQTFAQAISGLSPGTTYHFRAIATNGAGTSYGADRTLTTLAAPTTTTDPATSLEKTVAIINGTLDDDGGEACDCGFEYGETTDYGTTTPTESKETGETFSQDLTDLSPNTTYHFRAIATNSAGTSYGSDQTLTTLIEPTLTTDPSTAITKTTATLNGTLDDDGNEACDCGFEYGETTAYGTTTPTESKNTGETFSQDISDLTPGKHYHFRTLATNSVGTSYGSNRQFFAKLKGGNPNIDQRMFQHVERMGR